MTYIGDSSGVRNYVAFSDKDIRIDEHIRYQAEKNSLTSARSHAGLSPDFPDYRGLPNGENKYDGSVVRFPMSTFGKIIRHKGYDTKAIIPQLKEIFDNSVLLNFEEERTQTNRPDGSVHKKHDNFKGYHNYLGKFNDGASDYFVRFTVQEQKTRKTDYIAKELHSTYISEIEIYKADKSVSGPKIITRVERETVSSDNKLLQILAKIKSDAEKSSKIVDENGEPRVVYHGSPRDIFSALDKVIENAVFYDFRGGDGQKKHESISGQYLYKSAFRVGNSTFAATIILDEKKTTFSKVFKGYTISKIEVDGVDAASGSETTLREPVNRSTPDYITIAQAAKNVKPESSKIVDENGEPRVVYHGSGKHQRLTVLDPRRGYNTEAVWHATNPHVAMHWGDWRTTRFDEKLPDKVKGTITVSTFMSFLQRMK